MFAWKTPQRKTAISIAVALLSMVPPASAQFATGDAVDPSTESQSDDTPKPPPLDIAKDGWPEVPITNVSPVFMPGGYKSLAVDLADTQRIAIGTSEGHVLWTEDGARTSGEGEAVFNRIYDPYIFRGGSKAKLSKRDSANGKGSDKDPEGNQERSLILFLENLGMGRPALRVQFWMAYFEPLLPVDGVAIGPKNGPMFAASASGIHQSDGARGTWTRTLSSSMNPMQEEKGMKGVSVAVDPQDPKHVFAGTDKGVFVSRDGGYSFKPHPDPAMAGDYVLRFVFDPKTPGLVFAVTPYTVLMSEDSGEKFQPAFPLDEIYDLNVSPDNVLVSAGNGLHIVNLDGTQHVLQNKIILGAAPWRNGSILAISSDHIYQVTPAGEVRVVLTTTSGDAYLDQGDTFISMGGNAEMAWVLSRTAVLRIGAPIQTAPRRNYKPPRLLLSLEDVERRYTSYYGIQKPVSMRLHDRWYAKWVPRIDLTISNSVCGYLRNPTKFADGCKEASDGKVQGRPVTESELFDGVFPIRYRERRLGERSQIQFKIMAKWNLAQFLLGDNNAVNPNLPLESNLRDRVDMSRRQMRWRYREAAAIVGVLQQPPADRWTELYWRMRLEEMTSYLEWMTGGPVVADNDMEKLL